VDEIQNRRPKMKKNAEFSSDILTHLLLVVLAHWEIVIWYFLSAKKDNLNETFLS